MKIKNVELNNVRSHTNSKINFKEGVSVLTGKTGSGKSTLLMSIEYGLFGNETRIQNSQIMRRGVRNAEIRIEFTHKSHEYEITRGLKKESKKIKVDNDKLSIKKDGRELNIIKRSKDMNEIIKRILGFPKELNTKELFETTTYTKQDEIRKLIELKPEERQRYLDDIMQISRYHNTWANLKGVITRIEQNRAILKEKLKFLSEYEKDLENTKTRIKEIEKLAKKTAKELKDIIKEKEKFENEFEKKRQEFLALETSVDTYKKQKAVLSAINLEVQELKNALKAKTKEFNGEEIKKIKELDELVAKKAKKLSESEFIKRDIAMLNSEKLELREIGKHAVCPKCKQKIKQEHIGRIEEECSKKICELVKKMKVQTEELKEIAKEVEEIKNKKKEYEKEKEKIIKKKESGKRLSQKTKSANEIKELLNSLAGDTKLYNDVKEEIETLRKKEMSLIRGLAAKQTDVEHLKKEKALMEDEQKEKEKRTESLKVEEKKVEKTERVLKLLSKIREDTRNIRDVIRHKFLQDLKNVFQNKFEEIRKGAGEYVVSVKEDYEAVVYTEDGEETKIQTLSGGEKTSVALAFRLAIADIAARMGGIEESKILLLDEPTTGFDREDIKALPEVLKNLSSIPQIIIVTHEEELKNAADWKYEIKKENNVSIIREL